ncbi:hypothetical protein MWU59_09420 [Flavobacteriaceae bacterium F08102]|nr:hypothetical protein [Flavobacteriaceae bacterium F08102]
MKKYTLLLVTMFSFGLIAPMAANNSTDLPFENTINFENQITFEEGGISFSIFQNGEFDFYLVRQAEIHANARVGNVSITFNSGYNYDPYVQYDDYGAIIQIEDVPIYYDHYGRISKAGNVSISYQSNRVVRVGGMRIYYHANGHYSHYNGYINRYNRYYVFNPFHTFFVRPLFNRCIVSYKPYRRHYTPKRYKFWGHNRTAYKAAKRYNTRRNFRTIDGRIRTQHNSTASRRTNHTVRRDVRSRSAHRNSITQRRIPQTKGKKDMIRKPVGRRTNQTANNSHRSIRKPTQVERKVQLKRKVNQPSRVSTKAKAPTQNSRVRSQKVHVRKPATHKGSSTQKRTLQTVKKRSDTSNSAQNRSRR